MTDEAIRAGFAALRPASRFTTPCTRARCRSEADWLVGMNASRAFTLRYGALLSVGRVQTPTLAMLVTRRLGDRPLCSPAVLDRCRRISGDYQGVWFESLARGWQAYPQRGGGARHRGQGAKGRKPARVTGVKAEAKARAAPSSTT